MRALLGLLVVVLVPAASSAQDTPQALLERAITAHGGRANLSVTGAERVKLKGTLHVGKSALPFTNEMAIQLPGQYKSAVTITEDNRAHTVVHLLDGDKATILIDGQTQPVAGVHLAQLKQTLQLEQALRLVPLLTDPAYSLQLLPEVRYNTHVYAGVRVQGKGQRDLKLYFDGATGLLVKTEHLLDGPGGKDVVQEGFYGNHREAEGRIRAGTIVVLRDGKKVMEAELVEARRVERIDPIEFTRP